ncbi:unnamed protein product [Chrysoparadoxa australica]
MAERGDPRVAFALVCAAGLSTGVGALLVFNKNLPTSLDSLYRVLTLPQVKLASKRFLAGALGLSAGVMIYVSLVEILVKSYSAFEDAGHDASKAYTYATACFFGGVLFYKLIDVVVHCLDGQSHSHDVDVHLLDLDKNSDRDSPCCLDKAYEFGKSRDADEEKQHQKVLEFDEGSVIIPSAELHTLHIGMAGKVAPDAQGHNEQGAKTQGDKQLAGQSESETTNDHFVKDEKLVRMGLMTSIAIGIHNFPEGLATFVGALADPTIGLALAIAIAIHNIPEGMCVAIPVYYATGNRWKAFSWALFSGISEPIGAGLGWLILKDSFNDNIYGVLFGAVAGMMVNICVSELIPTANRYDPTNKVSHSYQLSFVSPRSSPKICLAPDNLRLKKPVLVSAFLHV